MGLKIKYSLEDFNKSQIIDKFGMQPNGTAELFLANTCFRRMEKYVPWRTGNLATTATIKPGKVIYEQPYAHIQFVSNKGKGRRGKRWDLAVQNNETHLIAKEVEAFVKKTKGNK